MDKRARERLEYDPLDPAKQHEVVSAGELVSSYVDEKVFKGASQLSKAQALWCRAAGTRAAKHTVAVWLSDTKDSRDLPELVVYLDGSSLMADLTTNAELYQERLAYEGLQVSHIRFKLSRKAGR